MKKIHDAPPPPSKSIMLWTGVAYSENGGGAQMIRLPGIVHGLPK